MSNKQTNKKNKQQAQQQQQQKKESKKQAKNKKTKSSSCLPLLFGIFVLCGAIVGLLVYDTNVNAGGVFEKSAVGKVLKDTGALPYVEKAFTSSMKFSARGYKWTEKNVPVYYNSTCKFLTPYLEVAKDLGKIAFNGAKNAWAATVTYVNTKTPVVSNFVEQYAPGLPEKTSSVCCSTWSSLKTVTLNTYTFLVEFFKTKVFVGSLSPENLGKLLNSTQQSMSVYCDRFHKNVDYYAKLK
uniref:CSON007941 protein n=1 Tax=Culicoides sonorensis TaxID=179676 RepID=A0A336LL84_CULSO